MLGAQARAAELAAASAAKQRQVSRELEERQQPPSSAVSLSIFTKPQPTTTRNKGTKSWKPLILDDINEITGDAPGPAVATQTPRKSGRITPREASDKRIPSAPRAMLTGRSTSATVAQTDQARTDSFAPSFTSNNLPPAYESTQTLITDHNVHLPQPPYRVAMPPNEFNRFTQYGAMMVPDDISPTKQEQKFSMLESVSGSHAMHQGYSHFQNTQQPTYSQDGSFSHVTAQQPGNGQRYMWDDSSHNNFIPGCTMPYQEVHQPYMGYYDKDGARDNQRAYMGQHEDSTDSIDPNEMLPTKFIPDPSREMRRVPAQILPRTTASLQREPYDTGKAMKDCVDKMKERAKDGKTVLHNPENRKQPQRVTAFGFGNVNENTALRKSSVGRRPVPWEVQPRKDIQDRSQWEATAPLEDLKYTDPESLPLKPAPGLPFPTSLGSFTLPAGSSLKVPAGDGVADVGSAAWMRLAPISAAERDRVRKCMAKAAKGATNHLSDERNEAGLPEEELLTTRKWFYKDARGEDLLRQQVNITAKDHAAKVVSDATAQNGGVLPKDFQIGKHDGLASSLILGNVACNLQTYLVGDRGSLEQKRNFQKVKTVPDWCTEKGGTTIGGTGSGESYFDGTAGGFYTAPVRVARDPRFRPQMKEGMKMKADEEWKNRHEMYGRRMM